LVRFYTNNPLQRRSGKFSSAFEDLRKIKITHILFNKLVKDNNTLKEFKVKIYLRVDSREFGEDSRSSLETGGYDEITLRAPFKLKSKKFKLKKKEKKGFFLSQVTQKLCRVRH